MYLKFTKSHPKIEEFFIEVDAYRVKRETMSMTDDNGHRQHLGDYTEISVKVSESSKNGAPAAFLLAEGEGRKLLEEKNGEPVTIWSTCYAQNDAGRTIDVIRPLS